MRWRICTTKDVPELSRLNGLLHEDEGAIPMLPDDREVRLNKWICADYTAVLFTSDEKTLGYVLFRSTDTDSEGPELGVFIRQFFVVRSARRRGVGRQMFDILTQQIWPAGCGILLDTEYENERAQRFWRSLGFTESHVSFVRRPS